MTVVTTVNTNYTANGIDEIILVNSTGGPITITIPGVHVTGKRYIVKDRNGTAATNNITIVSGDSDTFDGSSNIVLNVTKQSAMIHSDGSVWYLL